MKTQYDKLAKLLTRPGGATAMEIISGIGTVCPHKRMSEMAAKGWKITKTKVPGKTYHRYFGKPPRKLADYIPKTVWHSIV